MLSLVSYKNNPLTILLNDYDSSDLHFTLEILFSLWWERDDLIIGIKVNPIWIILNGFQKQEKSKSVILASDQEWSYN